MSESYKWYGERAAQAADVVMRPEHKRVARFAGQQAYAVRNLGYVF